MSGGRLARFDLARIALVLAFLYLPILLLVVYSFNASRLVTVWGGFSTQWYRGLTANTPLMEAAWTSVRIAGLSATVATILGTMAAVALARRRRFAGRTGLAAMIYAVLVMPEIILGLSLLLFFVAAGMARGFWTVTIAHTTFTLCFVAVIVGSRLRGVDRSLEEAALDLGATPLAGFFLVTLPIIAPAVASGWILAFTLSLDDLVIASFTTGPGATTLPMRIYSQVRLGVTPEINAISTILVALVTVAVIIASLALKTNVATGDRVGARPQPGA
jgi:putrescine transport system permease protein